MCAWQMRRMRDVANGGPAFTFKPGSMAALCGSIACNLHGQQWQQQQQ